MSVWKQLHNDLANNENNPDERRKALERLAAFYGDSGEFEGKGFASLLEKIDATSNEDIAAGLEALNTATMGFEAETPEPISESMDALLSDVRIELSWMIEHDSGAENFHGAQAIIKALKGLRDGMVADGKNPGDVGDLNQLIADFEAKANKPEERKQVLQ